MTLKNKPTIGSVCRHKSGAILFVYAVDETSAAAMLIHSHPAYATEKDLHVGFNWKGLDCSAIVQTDVRGFLPLNSLEVIADSIEVLDDLHPDVRDSDEQAAVDLWKGHESNRMWAVMTGEEVTA